MKVFKVGLTAVAMVALAACGGGGSADDNNAAEPSGPVTIRIAHNSNAGVLPAKIAAEKGFFKKHGIEAKFTKIENIATLPAALGKSFDIALSVPTIVVNANLQGIKVIPVAGATLQEQANPQSAVIASPKSGVTTLADLKGKTLGVPNTTGTLHLATRMALKKAGIDPDSVKTLQVDPPAQADQLRKARVDAVEAVAPFSTRMLGEKGNVDLGDPYGSLSPSIAAIGWVSTDSWASENKATLDDFRAALNEAIDFIAKNPTEATAVLKEYTGLSDEVLKITKMPSFTAEVRRADWDIWLTTMREVGGFTANFNMDTLFPNQ